MNSKSISIIRTTESSIENVLSITKKILEKKLAACASYKQINSSFWWKNKLVETKEFTISFKTTKNNTKKLISFLKSIHSYETPEILIYDAISDEKFLKWVNESVN